MSSAKSAGAGPAVAFPSCVLLLSESSTRCGAILTWMAAENRTSVVRVPGYELAHDGSDVRMLEIVLHGSACRIYGAGPSVLRNAQFAPIAKACDRILVIGALPVQGSVTGALEGAIVAAAPQFQRSPLVSCIYPRSAGARASAATKKLQAAGFSLNDSRAEAGDFAAIWRELCTALPAATAGGAATPGSGSSPASPREAKTFHHATGSENSKGFGMANAVESLNSLMQIEGAVGGLIADWQSGMLLAKTGGGVNLEIAAAGNSEVIKSKMKTMQALGIKEGIEDILITLGTQYHVIRPLVQKPGLFLYLVLDKAKSNLAMARFKVSDVEKTMTI